MPRISKYTSPIAATTRTPTISMVNVVLLFYRFGRGELTNGLIRMHYLGKAIRDDDLATKRKPDEDNAVPV